VNCLRDNPMTQFSIQWILSLNHLSQNRGQVQAHAYRLAKAAGNRAQLWIVEGAGHGVYKGEVAGPENRPYRERILSFLDSALAAGKQPSAVFHGERDSLRVGKEN